LKITKTTPLNFVGIENQRQGIRGSAFSWNRKRGEIKQQLEDFIVYEIAPDGKIIGENSRLKAEDGLFSHFILEKRGLDTLSAKNNLYNYFRRKGKEISENDIKFAGLKDARAVTYQRGSIWNINPEELKEFTHDRLSVYSAVKGLYEIIPGMLKGNHFKITVRTAEETDSENLKLVMEKVKKDGIPNFFMLQRFGSLRPVLHMVGRSLLEKDYKSAVLGYMCTTSNLENETVSKARAGLAEKGLDGIPAFLKAIPSKYYYERKLAKHLNKRHPNYQRSIFSLPKDFLSLSLSAFQSYLFNKVISKLWEVESGDLAEIPVPLIGKDYI